MLNRVRGRRRQNSADTNSNHSVGMDPNDRRMDAGDGDVNDADFLPTNPVNYYGNEHHRDMLNQLKDILCLLCQAVFIVLCVYTLVVLNKVEFSDDLHLFSNPKDKLPHQLQTGKQINSHDSKERRLMALFSHQIEIIKQRQRELRTMCVRMKAEYLMKVSAMITEAISLHNADKTGLIDFALESNGGAVTSTPNTEPFENHMTFSILGLVNVHSSSNPRFMINPDTHPGQCFAFRGATGRIRVRLSQEIKIGAVTLEHVDPRLVTDTSSAPKDFKVLGLDSESDKIGKELGQFTYKINEGTVQTFLINSVQQNMKFGHVELNILTNYGNPNYTCIYRFRVHRC